VSRRFLATYVALVVVVLGALEIPLGIEYGRSERRDLTGRIERDALTMATFAEGTLERGLKTPPAALVRVAKRYQRNPGGRVVIVDGAGLALLDTHPPFPGRRSFASRPEFAAALAGNIASGTRHSNTLRANLIYVAVPIASGGRVRGAVRITYPSSTLDTRVRRYWLLLAALGGVVLAAATVVGLRFARTLTEPLSALERTAAAVGAGDLRARAPADSGPPEVRALATEFNETVARLDTLLRSQKEFVADASHQLRTPLAALQLRLENVERDLAAGGNQDIQAALAEVTRLARLVDGLLTLARADAARSDPAPVDLAAVVRTRVDAWSAEAGARGVPLDVRLPERLVALATPGAVEQILDNLISNALAVSRPGQTITIEAGRPGREVTLHVRDEGPGMTAEQRSRAFDRFWRAGPPGSGTGLGLAIAHRLVTAAGGTIQLRDAARVGLDVVIALPAGGPSSSRGTMDARP
jgi:signal transduction histidine kinase